MEETNKSWLFANKFYHTTLLAGFGFISSSGKKFEAMLWFVLVFICVIITLVETALLVQQYINNPSVTEMELSENGDKLFKFPDSTLCLGIYMPDFHLGIIGKNSADKTPYANASAIGYGWWKQLNASLAYVKSKSEFLGSKHWPYVFIPLAQRYFSFIYAVESHGKNSMNSGQYDEVVDLVKNPPSADDSLFGFLPNTYPFGKATNEFVQKVRGLQISDTELLEKFQAELLHLFNITVAKKTMDGSEIISKAIQNLTAINEFYSCFGVSLGKTEFDMKTDSLIINTTLFYLNVLVSESLSSDDYDILGLYAFDFFELRPNSKLKFFMQSYKPEKKADLEVYYEEIDHGDYAVVAQYQLLDGHCSQSKSTCEANCRAQTIRQVCNCEALFYKPTDTVSKPQCTGEHYLKCLTYNSTIVHQCYAEKCPLDCKQTQFKIENSVKTAFETATEEYIYLSHGIRVGFQPTLYPSFRERSEWTFQKFNGDLGGVLGFWIGASYLGLIHVILYVCKQCYYAANPNTKTGEIVRKITSNGETPRLEKGAKEELIAEAERLAEKIRQEMLQKIEEAFHKQSVNNHVSKF